MDKYFGEWMKVIDKAELIKVINKLDVVYGNRYKMVCPKKNLVFKAFNKCNYDNLKVVIIGEGPYPQLNVATGIAFGNTKGTPLSPSLEVIKESVFDFANSNKSGNFDQTLESWCKQGVLMLNTALTCEAGFPKSHILLWRPFITKLLINLSLRWSGLVYLLLGEEAKALEEYIDNKRNSIICCRHPSYYARKHKCMPSRVFKDVNDCVYKVTGTRIDFINNLNSI